MSSLRLRVPSPCWSPLLLLALLLGAAGCGGGPELSPEEQAELDALPAADKSAAGSSEPSPTHSSLDAQHSSLQLIANGTDHVDVRATIRNRANEPLARRPVVVSLGPPPTSAAQGNPSVFAGVTDDKGTVRGTLATTRADIYRIHLLIGGTVGFVSAVQARFYPGPPATLAIPNPVGAVQRAGTPFSMGVLVHVVDAQGNATPGVYEVSLSVGNGTPGASLGGSLKRSSDKDGYVHFTEVFPTRIGQGYTLRAEAPGLTPGQSNPFEVRSGPPYRNVFLDEPGDVVVGELLPPLRVAQEDVYGNRVVGYTTGTPLLFVRLQMAGEDVYPQGPSYFEVHDGIAVMEGLRIPRTGEDFILFAKGDYDSLGGTRPFRVLPAPPTAAGAAPRAQQ